MAHQEAKGSCFSHRLSFLWFPFKYTIVFSKTTLRDELAGRSKEEVRDIRTHNSPISHDDFYSVYPGFFCHVPTPKSDFRAQLTKKCSSIWPDHSKTPVNFPLDPALMLI